MFTHTDRNDLTGFESVKLQLIVMMGSGDEPVASPMASVVVEAPLLASI